MRKEKSIKNFITNIIPFFILTILGFLRLKVLLNSLGDDIYALNQLFIQVFSYVSLLEAGVGTLITQMYYKYFVSDDKKSINEVFTTSKRILNKISLLMLLVGFAVSFFLKILTNNEMSLIYMQMVFMLYLFRSVLEYLMFSPRFVLTADQKVYKINLWLNLFKIIEIIAEICILQVYKNYAIILLSSIVLRFIAYTIANKTVYKEYPWLKVVDKKDTIKINGMKNVVAHKLAGTIFSNTDILLASSFLKPIYVVIYSSYNYIVKFIGDAIYMFASAITASMGNVMYKENKDDQIKIFDKTNSIFLFCSVFFTVALYLSTNKFVELWIGKTKMMDSISFIFIIITLFQQIVNRPLLVVRDSKALYKETKVIALIEAIINLVLSILLVRKYKIAGLLFATIIASLVNVFYPIVIIKNQLKGDYKKYYLKVIETIVFTFFLCYLLGNYNLINNATNYFMWFIYSVVYCIVILIVTFIFYYLTSKDFKNIVSDMIELLKKRRSN